MSLKQNDEYYEQMNELLAEVSRDRWMAQDAINRLHALEPMDQIETEPLEALCAFLQAELQDRNVRTETPCEPF